MTAVNTEVIGGINSYVLYGLQSVYTTAVTPDKIFGGLITNASFSVDRQYNERSGFAGTGTNDGRVTSHTLPGTLSTSASISFDAQRWDWIAHALLASRTGSGTSGTPYLYTVGNTANYLTLSEEIDNVATNSSRAYPGMVINNVSIKCGVGEPVGVTVDLIGGLLSVDTTLSSRIAQNTDDVYNFSGGSITFNTTTLGNVIDSVDLNISNNHTVIYGFSEEAKNAKPGKFSVGLRFTAKYLDDSVIEQMLGSSTGLDDQTPINIKLKFEKGDSYVEFTLKGAVVNRDETGHQLNEFVVEDVDIIGKALEIREVL